MSLRRELHRRGLRFFVHRRVVADLRAEADVLFPRRKIAVFVDGCYWHGCPEHRTFSKTNEQFWLKKIEGNIERDARVSSTLTDRGWTLVRAWEHEPTSQIADRIVRLVRATPGGGTAS